MGKDVGNENHEIPGPPNKFGTRHVQVFWLFMGMAIAYALRVCMSVAIVAMRNNKTNPDFPAHNWDKSTSDTILSSFFWGYVVTQLPAGHIASTRSAQKLLAFGMFISSVLSMLTPFLANYGYIPVLCCRVAMGLTQGCLLPCVHTLLSRWVPPTEKARLGSFVMNGPQLGTVITMPISGIIAASSIGWPSIFYIFGAVGIAWSIGFFCLGADRPSEHPKICPNEAHYINSSLGNLVATGDRVEILTTPWKSILTSVPMLALVIVHCGHNWGYYTLLTELPTYMKSALNFDISQSGSISALPYLTMWLLGFPISFISDWVLRKGVTPVIMRKICNSIGLWIPAAAMIILCIVTTTDTKILVAILIVAVGFNAGVSCGLQINHIDLSPNFAGVMMSISNFCANIFGIIAPLVCGAIVPDETDINQWHLVFYITAGVYFVTNLIFLIFGKAEVQPWNEPENKKPTLRTGRVSVISLGGEPTSMTIPEQIKEETPSQTPC